MQGINLDSLFKGVNRAAVWDTHKLLADGIASGEVQPLPYTVYSRQKIQDAFRFLAGGEVPAAASCLYVLCVASKLPKHCNVGV